MRWISNRESVEAEEISALALFETGAAMILSISIAVYFHSIIHIAFSAAIAPFLLLRTDATAAVSMSLCRRLSNPLFQVWDRTLPKILVPLSRRTRRALAAMWGGFIVAVLGVVVLTPICKALATGYGLLRSPGKTISSTTRNWRQICFCVDSCHTPEIITGIEDIDESDNLHFAKISVLLSMYKNYGNEVYRPVLLMCLLVVFLSASIYRWSLKSTAIIWSPLLWIAGQISEVDDLRQFLTHVVGRIFYRISRIYSVFVMILFAVKIYLVIILQDYKIV